MTVTTPPRAVLPTPARGFDPARDPYALVIGHGRSGTNLALDLLDCHPDTVCRSELNRSPDGSFAGLPGDFLGAALPDDFIERWHRALTPAPWHRWDRDHGSRGFKSYYRSSAAGWIAEHMLPRPRLRRVLAPVVPALRRTEWPVGRLHRPDAPVLPVLKILLQPHWIGRTHAADDGQRVIHVLRAPEGFIRSWRNRWVASAAGGPEAVYAANLETLPGILEALGGRRLSHPAFSEAALIESELWRWRYMNEIPFAALHGTPRYRAILYDRLTDAPAETAGDLCAFLGLTLDEQGRARAAAQENRLFAAPHTASVDAGLVADLAAGVLDGSPLRALFPRPAAPDVAASAPAQ